MGVYQMKLYFPTTSLNFNDILATESISPTSFYKERLFGTKRNFSTELSYNELFITLSKNIPSFKLMEENTSEYDQYPIIIEIDINEQKYNLINLGKGLYGLPQTFYFNKDNVRFHFLSENDLNKIVVKSKLVAETKLVSKYKTSFYILDKSIQGIKADLRNLINPPINKAEVKNELYRDRLFNNVKGIYYGFLSKFFAERYHEFNDKGEMLQKRVNLVFDLISLNSDLGGNNSEEYIDANSQIIKKIATDELIKHKDQFKYIFKYIKLIKFDMKKDISLNPLLFSSTNERKLCELILNLLVENPKLKVGEVPKEEFKKIINDLKHEIHVYFRDVSFYTEEIELIFNRVINRDYNVDVNNFNSVVFKNFIAFVLKHNNPEELQSYIHSKNIEDGHCAYMFLGAYYGFSGLNKNICNSLLNIKNDNLFNLIEEEVNYLMKNIWKTQIREVKISNEKCFNYQKINSRDESYQQDIFSIVPFNKSILPDQKDLLNSVFQEVQRIRKAEVVNDYLNIKGVTLEDKTQVFFNKQENSDIEIKFFNRLYDPIVVLLRNKNNADNKERKKFKGILSEAGLNKSVCSGNFPIIKCYKGESNLVEELDNRQLQLLLKWLQLLT